MCVHANTTNVIEFGYPPNHKVNVSPNDGWEGYKIGILY